ncbi:MAG: hypothetical protein JW934_08065 [Anaerolineae bacterium]|nr:hypothetical protein [Anaerolineae bacterium]
MDTNNKRPTPPPEYVPFRWQHKAMQRGTESTSVPVCPNCNAPGQNGKWGYVWEGDGWTDPGAQSAYDQGKSQGIRLMGAGDSRITYEGVPVLIHWSRVGIGKCLVCGCKFWHDFGGQKHNDEWAYYYKPTRGQLALF